jgi:hypothetical protein
MAKDARTWQQHADEIRRQIRAAEDRGDGIAAREWTEAFNEAQANAELATDGDFTVTFSMTLPQPPADDTNAEVK